MANCFSLETDNKECFKIENHEVPCFEIETYDGEGEQINNCYREGCEQGKYDAENMKEKNPNQWDKKYDALNDEKCIEEYINGYNDCYYGTEKIETNDTLERIVKEVPLNIKWLFRPIPIKIGDDLVIVTPLATINDVEYGLTVIKLVTNQFLGRITHILGIASILELTSEYTGAYFAVKNHFGKLYIDVLGGWLVDVGQMSAEQVGDVGYHCLIDGQQMEYSQTRISSDFEYKVAFSAVSNYCKEELQDGWGWLRYGTQNWGLILQDPEKTKTPIGQDNCVSTVESIQYSPMYCTTCEATFNKPTDMSIIRSDTVFTDASGNAEVIYFDKEKGADWTFLGYISARWEYNGYINTFSYAGFAKLSSFISTTDKEKTENTEFCLSGNLKEENPVQKYGYGTINFFKDVSYGEKGKDIMIPLQVTMAGQLDSVVYKQYMLCGSFLVNGITGQYKNEIELMTLYVTEENITYDALGILIYCELDSAEYTRNGVNIRQQYVNERF